MQSTMRFFTMIGLTSLLGAIFVVPGCGGDVEPPGATIEDVCEQFCSCGQTCGESARADCIRSGEEQQDLAVAGGCSDTFDEYLQCLNDNLDCNGGGSQLPPACNAIFEEVMQCTGGDDAGG